MEEESASEVPVERTVTEEGSSWWSPLLSPLEVTASEMRTEVAVLSRLKAGRFCVWGRDDDDFFFFEII